MIFNKIIISSIVSLQKSIWPKILDEINSILFYSILFYSILSILFYLDPPPTCLTSFMNVPLPQQSLKQGLTAISKTRFFSANPKQCLTSLDLLRNRYQFRTYKYPPLHLSHKYQICFKNETRAKNISEVLKRMRAPEFLFN